MLIVKQLQCITIRNHHIQFFISYKKFIFRKNYFEGIYGWILTNHMLIDPELSEIYLST